MEKPGSFHSRSTYSMLLPSRKENVNNLGAAVQHNFRRTLLVPSREKNINSLAAAVQHNFWRTLLVPSREENINSLGAAVQPGPKPGPNPKGCKIIYNEIHKAGQQRWRDPIP